MSDAEADPRAAAQAELATLQGLAASDLTPGQQLRAAVLEVRRRGAAVPAQARQTADTVEALAEYLARQAPPIDLYDGDTITGDPEQDHALLRSIAVEAIGVQGSWTAADWLRLLVSMLEFGAIVLGIRTKADGAVALFQAAKLVDGTVRRWW